MYQPGQLVVYGGTGVCRVEGLADPDPKGNSIKQFYLLTPLYQAGIIYTPLEGGKVPMRPVMTTEEANALIDRIPELCAEIYRERTLQLLAQRYQTVLQSGDCADLLELTMSVYRKRKLAEEQKHRLGLVDEKYGKQAERLLFGELAVALDISIEEVPSYIDEKVKGTPLADIV